MGLYDDDVKDAKESESYKKAKELSENLAKILKSKEAPTLDVLADTITALAAAVKENDVLADTDPDFKEWLTESRKAGRTLKDALADGWDAFAKAHPDFVRSLDAKEGFYNLEVMDGRFGFSMLRPDGWFLSTDNTKRALVKPFPEAREFFSVSTEALGAAISMEHFASYSIEKLRREVPGCNIVDRRFTSLDGRDAYEMAFTFTEEEYEVKGVQIFTMNANVAITLTYVAYEVNFAVHEPVVAEMVGSFKIYP